MSCLALNDREDMLEARSVSKSFGGVAAVDDVSFTIGTGEVVGLIGPNGAGKTTMFNLLAGSLQPSRGDILLQQHSLAGLPAYRRLALGLGRTFQIPRLFAEMTVVENLLTAAQHQSGERLLANWLRPGAVRREEAANLAKAMEMLKFLGLSPLARQPARVLSGGQRKLVELGRVLMADPRIILLDEPAAGVNPTLLEAIIDRLQEINRRGITLLIIEHNMDMIARLCSRVLVMANGRLLCAGTPEAVVADPRVIDAYLGGAAA
ncbi:MAG TPA: ABC transporter ATP-binding protein [Dongiaceae bacterium]|nr:ABC transporter ATP-binding protein [Dongiaceae bacterium]